MATFPKPLLDALTRHAIDLTRFSNGEVRRIIALLNRADADLFAKLQEALDRLPPGSATLAQLDATLSSIKALNKEAYKVVESGISKAMSELAPVESSWQLGLYRRATAQEEFASVTAQQAKAAALSRPFQGRLLKEWAVGIESARMTRIRDTVRIGYLSGETTSQIVRRLRGTQARGYSDGIIEADRRNLESIVRTALSHTAASARDAFYDANDDILGNEVWISTLDSRTSQICRLRSGLEYDKNHKPVGHSYPYLGGPGKAHFCCRSQGIRLLKGQMEFYGTQSSADGYVDANISYGEWLKTQPASVQDDVLGPARGKLFRDGGLEIRQFANDKGRMLTLDELEQRNKAAFEKAGIE